jgi:hypothetical protein
VNPFDYTKAFTDFWSAQGEAVMKAQEQATRAMADGMQAMASGTMPMPGMPSDFSASSVDLGRASQSMMELLSAANALSATLAKAFPDAGDQTAAATFRKMTDPQSWMAATGEMEDVLGRMAEGPRFADLWQVERFYARVLQAWIDVRRRGFEHNSVVLEAWLKAGRQFTEELSGLAAADGKVLDAKVATALWTDIANRQLLETQRSEPYLQTQSAMIRASTELRMAQQDLVEHFGKQYGFPTRTELDDVHRSITELRREVRALRRQKKAGATPPAEAPPRPFKH